MLEQFTTTKKEWIPNVRQTLAASVPFSVLELFYGGAAGGGKTDLGVVMPVIRPCRSRQLLWYQHPMFKGLIIRRTIPELKKELVKRCMEYLPQTGGKYNHTDRVWSWPWGAQLFLNAAEHEEDIRRYDTEQFSYIFFEELTSFTEFQYLYMLSRCRSADADLPALMFSASNPGNIGHGWVRKRFVEPCKEGGKILRQYFFDKHGQYILEENPDHANFGKPKFIQRIFIRAFGSDNPQLLKNDPDYLVRLEALPEAEKAAKLYGDWWTFSGQVFDTFRAHHYPDEPENALHVIPDSHIPDWWPKILAIDWGYKAATVGLWGAISPQGRCFVYREYYVRNTEVAVWATEMGEASRGEALRAVVLDTNAWDQRGEEKTIAAQFTEKFTEAYGERAIPLEQASKGRVSGKTLVQEYLRWRPKPVFVHQDGKVFDEEEAARLKRLSQAAWQRYIELFAPPQIEDHLPRLQILDVCRHLIECIPLCVYDAKDVEDVAEWDASDSGVGDDPYDCLRYLLKRADRYVREARHEFDRRAKEDVIVKEFHETSNVTGFYRKMEKLESRGNHPRISVRRHGSFARRAAMRRLYR
jgi:hypothetical protein